MIESISRNAPCPCGSGLKYKKCCINKIMPAKTPKQSEGAGIFDEYNQELSEFLKGKDLGNFEALQEEMNKFQDSYNKRSRDHFFGLSSDDVYRMNNHPFEKTSDIVLFNENLPTEYVDFSLVIGALFCFLDYISRNGPLKATKKGNLPLYFSREMHFDFFDPVPQISYTIQSEEESLGLRTFRHLITELGYIKLRKNIFSLTKRGESLLESPLTMKTYIELLKGYSTKINWAFRDGYPSVPMFQTSFFLNLYFLHKKAKDFYPSAKLAAHLLEAIPELFTGVNLGDDPTRNPEDLVEKLYRVRFLERYCEFLGLVQIQKKSGEYGFENVMVKTTELFNEFFLWRK